MTLHFKIDSPANNSTWLKGASFSIKGTVIGFKDFYRYRVHLNGRAVATFENREIVFSSTDLSKEKYFRPKQGKNELKVVLSDTTKARVTSTIHFLAFGL